MTVINWRQLLLAAMVAAVFGTGFGYVGANFETAWTAGISQAEDGQPVSKSYGSLENRVERLEKAVGAGPLHRVVRVETSATLGTNYKDSTLERWSLDARLSSLEQYVRDPQPGMAGGRFEDRIRRLECQAAGNDLCW